MEKSTSLIMALSPQGLKAGFRSLFCLTKDVHVKEPLSFVVGTHTLDVRFIS